MYPQVDTLYEFLDKKFLRKYRKTSIFLIIFIVYLIIDIIIYLPQGLKYFDTRLIFPGDDVISFAWFLNWMPYALSHHLNPFITNYIWYPSHTNLTWSTSIPGLSFLLSPITLLFSSIFSYNFLTLLIPLLTSISFFYLVFYVTKKILPSLVGGYLFGFSSYVVAENVAHPNLSAVFVLPIIILLILRLHDQKISKKWFIGLTSLLLIFQFLTSTELITTFLMFLSIFGLLVYLFLPKERQIIKKIVIYFFWSGVIALILLSPVIYYLIIGYKNVPKVINSPLFYSADLLNFIIPTPMNLLGSKFFQSISSHFTGNYAEQSVYIGLPALIIILDYFKSFWSKNLTKVLVVLLAIISLFSLGQVLQINGIQTNLTMPWNLFVNLPILRNVLPTRFGLYVDFIIALVIGLWLAKTKYKNYTKIIVVTIILIFSLPTIPSITQWPDYSNLNYSKNISSIIKIPKQTSVLVLPYSWQGPGMYLQLESKMNFKLQDAYVGFVPPKYYNTAIVQLLLDYSGTNQSLNQQFYTSFDQYIISNRVSSIICTPGTNANIISYLNSLKWPVKQIDGSSLYQVPPNFLTK